MARLFAFTLDLEPDFLSENSHEVLLDAQKFGEVAACLGAHRVQPTVFVAGKMLDEGLPVRERFAPLAAEFELHSYSHSNREPDSEAEILRGKGAFERYFGRAPKGYRAPSGIISRQGVEVLAREGFLYDASVFPTWRPELGYNFSKLPTVPWRYSDLAGFTEIPFGVVPGLRLVISLSFLKLFGLGLYRNLFRTFGFPEILVFDSHLYDFFLTGPVAALPKTDWRRFPLTRNQGRVFSLLERFLGLLKAEGYAFVTMSEVYRYAQTRADLCVSSRALLDRKVSASVA